MLYWSLKTKENEEYIFCLTEASTESRIGSEAKPRASTYSKYLRLLLCKKMIPPRIYNGIWTQGLPLGKLK